MPVNPRCIPAPASLLAVAAVTLSACAPTAPAVSRPAASPPAVEAAVAAPPATVVRAFGVEEAEIGQAESLNDTAAEAADHLLGTSLDGERLYLSDYYGKALLVTYWSSGCFSCRAGMHRLRQVYRDYRLRGLEVLAVNIAEPPAAVRDYLERLDTPFPYPIAVDPPRRAPQFAPVTQVYDVDGVLAADYRSAQGFRTADLRRDLERILPTVKK